MGLLDDYVRASREHPCPICNAVKWCLIDRDDPLDPETVICPRVESEKRYGSAGWLHILRKTRGAPFKLFTRVLPTRERLDFEAMTREFRALVDPDRLHDLARGLGLSATSLRRLGIGLVPEDRLAVVGVRWAHHAWSFPMVDHSGVIVGIRLRLPGGRKLSVKGSRQGLFVPMDMPVETPRLFIAEGETDTAALLALGLTAIGRPGCTSGGRLVCRMVRRIRPCEVVVVGDDDDPGRSGAESLATSLTSIASTVRAIIPPRGINDARDWVAKGAMASDVLAAVDRARSRKLVLSRRKVR